MKLEIAAIVLVALAIVALLIFVPLGEIWALNTLFGLHIPFTRATWAASLLLGTTVFGSWGKNSK